MSRIKKVCYTHDCVMNNHLKSAALLFGDYTFVVNKKVCYTHDCVMNNHLKSATLLFGDYTFAKYIKFYVNIKFYMSGSLCITNNNK